MSARTVKTNPEHEVAYQDLHALVAKHADKLTAAELLAIASNMVGKLCAMQDQRVYTSEAIMEIVSSNIELGNQQMIEKVFGHTAGRA